MKKKTSVLLLILSVALVLISTAVLLMSVFGSSDFTDIRADLQGASAVYIDDEANAVYAYDGSLAKRNFQGERLVEYSFGEGQETPRISEINVKGGKVYVSLVDERMIVSFDEASGTPETVYRLLDPISKFVLDGNGEYLAVASKNGNKNYVTLLETRAGTVWADDGGAQTPHLCEIEYSTDVVSLYFEEDTLTYALKNGNVYSIAQDGEYSPERVLRTELTLIAYGNVRNGSQVAVSDKGIVAQYEGGERVAEVQLGGDVYCASVNEGSDLVSIGMRYEKMRFYSAESRNIAAKVAVFNEPTKIEQSADGADRIFVYESLSGSGMLIDLNKARGIEVYEILEIVFIVTEVVFGLFFIFSVLNISKIGGKLLSVYKKIGQALWKHKKSYLMLLPSFAALGVFNYFPAIWSFFLSLTEYKPGVYTRFVGLNNFITMFQNEYFWVGMGNMCIFLVTDLLKALIPPVIIAELIFAMSSKKAQYWTRVLMYVPGILPGVAGIMIWTSGILGMDGLINVFLRTIGLGHLAVDWLGNSETALWALVFIGFPYIGGYLLFYGAIMSVPKELFEAAKLDGCGWWQRLAFIDMPLISPQLKYVFVTGFIGSIQDFGRVWLTTGGGPGYSTYIPALELYYNISQFNDYGMAAAMGFFLFIIILAITIFNMRIKTQSAVGD